MPTSSNFMLGGGHDGPSTPAATVKVTVMDGARGVGGGGRGDSPATVQCPYHL